MIPDESRSPLKKRAHLVNGLKSLLSIVHFVQFFPRIEIASFRCSPMTYIEADENGFAFRSTRNWMDVAKSAALCCIFSDQHWQREISSFDAHCDCDELFTVVGEECGQGI
jgi:hypothetical protein